ncbi:MAG: hypothetical protein HY877_08740 [Deltaproteobacteria bacterium]|nr:hypothetical protein [Deltaproteobacteria bacterium]
MSCERDDAEVEKVRTGVGESFAEVRNVLIDSLADIDNLIATHNNQIGELLAIASSFTNGR